MHARPTRPRKTKSITIHLTEEEYARVSSLDPNQDLSPLCRSLVLAATNKQLPLGDSLCLAEISATRQEVQELLGAALKTLAVVAQAEEVTDADLASISRRADAAKDAHVERLIHRKRTDTK